MRLIPLFLFLIYGVFDGMQSTEASSELSVPGYDQAALLQTFVEHSPAAIAMFDQTMHYLLATHRWREDYDLADRDIIGQSHYDLFPDLPRHWKDIHQRCLADAIEHSDEEPITRADGSTIWLKWDVRPWYEQAGSIGGIMIFSELITEQKQQALALQQVNAALEVGIKARNAELEQTNEQLQQEIWERHAAVRDRQAAEAALHKEQEFLKTTLDHLADGIVACDAMGLLTLFNRATREFHGLPETSLRPDEWAPYFNLYYADGKTPMQTQDIPLFRAFEGEIVHNVEMVIAPKKGKTRTLLASGQAFFDYKGNKLGAVVAMQDITAQREREQKEAQLQEQEQFLRSIYDGVSCSIFVVDVLENGEFHYANHNHTSEQLTGYPSAAVAGKKAAELFGATEGAAIDRCLGRCVTARTALTETAYLTFNGKPTWVLTTFNPLINQEGRVHRIVGTSFNITDLKQAEAQLKQQAVDLEQALQELQRTQTQMVQSEKMSSLGQLVAGVAHEINNPVNFIHGNIHHASQYTQDLLDLLQLYQAAYPSPPAAIRSTIDTIDLDFLRDDLPKLLSSMKVGADRIREIVHSLRSFSRLDEAEVKDVDIHEGIDSTLMILHSRLKTKPEYPAIQVVKDYGALPRIECYAGQLNQVFMNILSNALDALDEHQQQRSPVELAEHPSMITIQTRAIDSETVMIQIADNGPGIPDAVQKRLFDPFFTTKAVGKGTGMGMSISHQVITERHKGSLNCLSLPGQGATFIMTIPIRQASCLG